MKIIPLLFVHFKSLRYSERTPRLLRNPSRCIERRRRYRTGVRAGGVRPAIQKSRNGNVECHSSGRWKWNERRQAAGDILSDFIYVARQQRYPIFLWKIGKALFP